MTNNKYSLPYKTLKAFKLMHEDWSLSWVLVVAMTKLELRTKSSLSLISIN